MPKKGAILNLDWFNRYALGNIPGKIVKITQSWDTAYKAEELLHSPSVCTTWGTTKNGHYLMHVFSKRLRYPELKKAVIRMNDMYHPHVVLIEDRASGQSLLQEFKDDVRINAVAVMPVADKITRMSSESDTIETGKVWIPMRGTAPWLESFESEVLHFPFSTFKDQMDSMSQFLAWARKKKFKSGFTFKKQRYWK